jgi:hypothetical protein
MSGEYSFLVYIFCFVWFLCVFYEMDTDVNGFKAIWSGLLLTICIAITILILGTMGVFISQLVLGLFAVTY